MTLDYLDLSWNNLNGSLPTSLCPSSGSSLINLDLGNNQLSGTLNLTGCYMLDLIDVSMNAMIAGVVEASDNRHISVAFLPGTNISNIDNLISGSSHVSSLDASSLWEMVVLPEGLSSLDSLIDLRIINTSAYGNIPDTMFNHDNLKRVELANNWISGTIPSVQGAKSLYHLDLSFNIMSGTIPPSLVNILGKKTSFLDLRLNYLSCCGIAPLTFNGTDQEPGTNVSYSGYDLSLPRLPPGLKFSTTLKAVAYSPLFQGLFTSLMNNLGNSSFQGLECPYLLLENDTDSPANYLDWNIDPEYYLFEGCQCYEGRRGIRLKFNGFLLMQCVDPLPSGQQWWQQYPWIIALIIIIGVLFLCLLFWSIYSAVLSARKQRALLKATQEAKEKLEKEHVRVQALLARQYDLIKCFEGGRASKSSDSGKAKGRVCGLTMDAIESAKRNIANVAIDSENPAADSIDNQIEIHQVIGEGSYGKVYRGLWRGTLVAIKTMLLPAHMSGQEKREKMASLN